MRQTRIIMGMPITVEIVGENADAALHKAFDYFVSIDERFSTYKDTSEISAINRGEVSAKTMSVEMCEVFALAEATRAESGGYFAIARGDGVIDPSGIVKGWAVQNAAGLIHREGFENFYIEAGGDIQTQGTNAEGELWRVGIRSPFNDHDIIKAVALQGQGIATSGTYVRGQHIYNPHHPQMPISDIVSLSVIGPNVLEADRFATAAFAMGEDGIYFIENLPGLEGYVVNASGIATQTTGFGAYVIS
jgi:FAD:protein FMN transferase